MKKLEEAISMLETAQPGTRLDFLLLDIMRKLVEHEQERDEMCRRCSKSEPGECLGGFEPPQEKIQPLFEQKGQPKASVVVKDPGKPSRIIPMEKTEDDE